MFPYRTLLILGAGASKPYLFPTGKELTNLILERDENRDVLSNMGFSNGDFKAKAGHFVAAPDNIILQYRHWLNDSLEFLRVNAEDFRLFQQMFHSSQAYSIDAFVADNPSFQPLASVLIALLLLRCEQEQRLHGDWYQLFINELIDEHGMHFPADTISIVTFNYDRSLEMYLFKAFKSRYNLDAARAWELVSRIEIIHVYGSLGSLFTDTGNRYLGYGAGIEAVPSAAKNLRLVGPRTNSEHLNGIRALVDRSPRIIFLGFGFDRLNLSQIQIPPSGNRKVFASCRGLPRYAMVRAESGLRKDITENTTLPMGPEHWITWGERSHNAVEFLENSDALV